jgi:hypothetical protein
MSHKSRQTLIPTPWEYAQWLADRHERAEGNYWRDRKIIRHPEAYAAVIEYNKTHGLTPRKQDEKLKFLHKTHGGTYKRKAPITLAKKA